MKRGIMLLVALAILGFAGAGLAQTSQAREPASGKELQPAKPKVAQAAKARRVVGEVVAVDTEARTVTIKKLGKKPEELTFAVEQSGAGALSELKPGDRLRITYVTADGKLLAKTIKKTAPGKKE